MKEKDNTMIFLKIFFVCIILSVTLPFAFISKSDTTVDTLVTPPTIQMDEFQLPDGTQCFTVWYKTNSTSFHRAITGITCDYSTNAKDHE